MKRWRKDALDLKPDVLGILIGVNDNGRGIAPGTYEYLLDYVHAGKTDRIRKKLVLTRQ